MDDYQEEMRYIVNQGNKRKRKMVTRIDKIKKLVNLVKTGNKEQDDYDKEKYK